MVQKRTDQRKVRALAIKDWLDETSLSNDLYFYESTKPTSSWALNEVKITITGKSWRILFSTFSAHSDSEHNLEYENWECLVLYNTTVKIRLKCGWQELSA